VVVFTAKELAGKYRPKYGKSQTKRFDQSACRGYTTDRWNGPRSRKEVIDALAGKGFLPSFSTPAPKKKAKRAPAIKNGTLAQKIALVYLSVNESNVDERKDWPSTARMEQNFLLILGFPLCSQSLILCRLAAFHYLLIIVILYLQTSKL
jgi:hypothetical protein